MSQQQTGSIDLDTAIAAESSATSKSLAATIPPELFKDILTYVGDIHQLYHPDIFDIISPHNASAVAARQEEMRHLSACALTCVYWAQLTRERMFRYLILRSSEDMSGLLSLLGAPRSPRTLPICDVLQILNVLYTLGDHLWFHNLAGMRARYQVSNFNQINFIITGPARPAFVTACTRGSMLHPLFFAVPRILPVIFPQDYELYLLIKNIHLPNPTVLSNLLQDCMPLQPRGVECRNLTWNLDPVLQATPSSIGLRYACCTAQPYFAVVSGCTDDVLVVAMLTSVPHHEFSQRRQSTHLDPRETSCLFEVMHTTWPRLSPELEQMKPRIFRLVLDSDLTQFEVPVRPPTGTDFSLRWSLDGFNFSCIASQLPVAADAAAIGNGRRNITYVMVKVQSFDKPRGYTETIHLDCDTLLRIVQQFPYLRQFVIYAGCGRHSKLPPSRVRRKLVEFLAHLGGALSGLDELLGLYYYYWDEEQSDFEIVQLRLDAVMDEIQQRREEIKAEADAEKAASSRSELSVVGEKSVSKSSTHTGDE